ncbi:hypothetical protein SUDANB1_00390 [Streptomyces sp. enrichment culture]
MPNAPSGPSSSRPPFWALLGALAVTAAGGARIARLRRRVSAHSGAHAGPSQRGGADGVGATVYACTHTTQELTDTAMPDLISRALTRRTVRTTKPARERTWQHLSPLLRLLILTQLTSGIGFFAVLPFLAEHLGTALGMAGWMVGLVLGLRTFSQQGLFVVGGALVGLPHSRLRSSGRDPHRCTPDRAGRLRAAGRRIRLAGVRGADLDGDRRGAPHRLRRRAVLTGGGVRSGPAGGDQGGGGPRFTHPGAGSAERGRTGRCLHRPAARRPAARRGLPHHLPSRSRRLRPRPGRAHTAAAAQGRAASPTDAARPHDLGSRKRLSA